MLLPNFKPNRNTTALLLRGERLFHGPDQQRARENSAVYCGSHAEDAFSQRWR